LHRLIFAIVYTFLKTKAMLKKLEKISSKVEFKNPYWKYSIDQYFQPDGKIGTYHYVDSFGSTMIIPELKQNLYLLVRQYRYLNQKISIEFPGGGLREGLDFLQNAKNELLEETGYEAKQIIEIAGFNPFNGVTNEISKVFLMKELQFLGNSPDDSEEFELLQLSKTDIHSLIKKGEIWDGMTLAAWSLFTHSEFFS
jgi:ADP-ribose pyrophosphatase